MSNPLLSRETCIPFSQIRPEHVEPAIDTAIAQANKMLSALLSVSSRTYNNTLEALEEINETVERPATITELLVSTCSSEPLRIAHNAVVSKISEFSTKLRLHDGLWAAVQDFAATPEAKQLTGDRKRFLEKTIRDFKAEGVDLPAEQKARLQAILAELALLTTQFSEHVLDATKAYELLITDPAELRGLPASALSMAIASARNKGLGSEEHPVWRFTLQEPSYGPFITYADNRELRRQIFMAREKVGTEGTTDNRGLILRILALRQEWASLLGHANFADYILERRMAKNGNRALGFESDLGEHTQPYFERENQALAQFRRQLEEASTDELQPWDIAYYAEKQRAALYDFDEEMLRPYFPLPQVQSGLFDIAQRIFGIQVTERPTPEIWHPDVCHFDIHDASGTYLGSFYTDWYPRESKRGGAFMQPLITGRPVQDGNDGHVTTRLEPHIAAVVGNFAPPIDGKPALLHHREVETMFHEFGHLLHHILSRVSVRSLAGANVEWDFVELPSQMMENWTWTREALDLFARHYETGEPIPQVLYDKMIAAQNYRSATGMMRQLMLGTLDLSLHIRYNPTRDGELLDYANCVTAPYQATQPLSGSNIATRFSHLFSDPIGYAAGYYSYKWAEVLDADAFTRFQQEGIFNPATGQAFVEHILSKGNSQDPMELFKGFMGREPNPQALLERSRLTQ